MSQYHDNTNIRDHDDYDDAQYGPPRATPSTPYRKWYRKPIFWAGVGGCVVLIAIVAVFVTLTKPSFWTFGVTLPPPEVSQAQLQENRNSLKAILTPQYQSKGLNATALSDANSFQARALTFVAGSTKYSQWTASQNVERYAATIFYLSTFRQPNRFTTTPGPWARQSNWVTSNSLCQWQGIVCDGNNLVSTINLTNNGLSGTLPLEMSFFQSLARFDFSSNLIYMSDEHHKLWTLLPNLIELSMSDNFFLSQTGLPVEFAGLANIEKIALSYNLLQGSFTSDVFSSLPNLVHFEAESNYIEGTLPSNLMKLQYLTYLYLRHNSFTFALSDLLQSGNLPYLFALWLDGNVISGSIPTSIGTFTSLASFSVPDAALVGTIPTEMALLTALQRVWLYNNQLSGSIPSVVASAWSKLDILELYSNNLVGTMPQPICAAIKASTYASKALTADCSKLKCDCCTTCY